MNSPIVNHFKRKPLVISSYAPPAIGGPNNLYCLLRDTDPQTYSILTSFYNIDTLSAQVGNWLKGDYFFYDNPAATKAQAQNPPVKGADAKKRTLVQRLKFLVKRNKIVRTLVGVPIIFIQIFAIYRTGKKVAQAKSSEAIMAFSDYGPALIGSYFLHKKTKLPLYLFMFDLYYGNFFPFPGNALARIFEPKLFRAAEKIVVTNQGTKDFYEKRYGTELAKKIVVLYNATFPEAYQAEQQAYNPKPPYNILFTGRISWPQLGALKNLVQAVDGINDLEIRLRFYCPNPKAYIEKLGMRSTKIDWAVAAPSEMAAIQSRADILFLPLSWDTQSQSIIDTATPGKLTDYLIAGRPMLIHAPESTYLVRYARENEFAMIADQNDIPKLRIAIRNLLSNPALGRKLVENAQLIFNKNHDANRNAALLATLFDPS